MTAPPALPPCLLGNTSTEMFTVEKTLISPQWPITKNNSITSRCLISVRDYAAVAKLVCGSEYDNSSRVKSSSKIIHTAESKV
ncbi:Hypothetical predicted protein [Octopus vulgaris]|uniref:Uncharacterized protein n=1 Tax=Octopus vulgaris TaxID=6645 RepID=A0AA36AR09_OCTVU|nr:Hypothetical predicted protein [Octopus vulgaris]